MTRHGMRRPDKICGDSPVRRSSVPIASSRLASSTRGTASRLPFGSTVESWPPQPSACPRPSPHAVPRVEMQGDARGERGGASPYSAIEQRDTLLVGVAGKKLPQHLAERCPRVQLGEDS